MFKSQSVKCHSQNQCRDWRAKIMALFSKRYPNKNIHEVVPSFEDFVEFVLRGKTKEDRHTEPSWFSCNMCQAQYDVIGTLF